MSNILYIGPYREFSSEGNIARNYIRSLVRSKHNLTIKPIYNILKSFPESEMEKDILPLENNNQEKYHTIIQHCYPHHFCFDRRFDQHIGIPIIESKTPHNSICNFLDTPDKMIAPSKYVKDCLGHFHDKVSIIPVPIDIESINDNLEKYSLEKRSDNFKFYVVADFVDRSNIKKIVECFRIACNDTDADLIIKTKNYCNENEDLYQVIEYELDKIDNTLMSYSAKPKIIVGEVGNEAMNYLHRNNDCLIDLGSGKRFGYSTLQGLAFNSSVITISDSAQSEIIANTDNFVIDSELVNCEDDNKTYDFYNTVFDKWLIPTKISLIYAMKSAMFEDRIHKKARHIKAKDKLKTYDINHITNVWNKYDL